MSGGRDGFKRDLGGQTEGPRDSSKWEGPAAHHGTLVSSVILASAIAALRSGFWDVSTRPSISTLQPQSQRRPTYCLSTRQVASPGAP